ncbi:MAG: hypothetical protein JWO17_3220 [Actinomycetia bacterium]|nr:hypothetical protein [Actinomycetes bacterium]
MSTIASKTMATNTTQSASTPAVPPEHDETLLTDDVLETVKEIALDELPGGTIVGIEADANGAGYLAHMLNADGTPMTVYLDASFDFVELS